MIDHMSTYATDYTRTLAFYEAALGELGCSKQMEFSDGGEGGSPTRRNGALGPEGNPAFWIIEVDSPFTPRHFAFCASSHAQVDAFYKAGLAAGGQDNGAPGVRAIYHPDYYGAFLIDPDGNNIEAVCHLPQNS